MSRGTLFERFIALDAALAEHGVPRCSSWWRAELKVWLDSYEAGSLLEWWACVGRGGAKSTLLYKLATFFTLDGDFAIPNGERHYAIVLSRLRDEANKGIGIISAWLGFLGVKHDVKADVIDLADLNRGIRIVAASVAGASGWRGFALFCDEFAKWQRDGERALDADEVLASAKAMLATHAKAPVFVMSSPWAAEGSFFKTITDKPADTTHVSRAASWIANPDLITEELSRKRERNERVWRREYAAEFVEGFEDGFFPSDALASCTDAGRPANIETPAHPRAFHIIAIDPAFARDRFATCIAHIEASETGAQVVVDHVSTLQERNANLSPEYAIDFVKRLRASFRGSSVVYSDQFGAVPLTSLFLQRGLILEAEPWSQQSKIERFSLVRSLFVDGHIRLPDCDETRGELSRIGVRLSAAGNELVQGRGGDDRAHALVSCVWHAWELVGSQFQAVPEDGKAKAPKYPIVIKTKFNDFDGLSHERATNENPFAGHPVLDRRVTPELVVRREQPTQPTAPPNMPTDAWEQMQRSGGPR